MGNLDLNLDPILQGRGNRLKIGDYQLPISDCRPSLRREKSIRSDPPSVTGNRQLAIGNRQSRSGSSPEYGFECVRSDQLADAILDSSNLRLSSFLEQKCELDQQRPRIPTGSGILGEHRQQRVS